MSTAVDPNPQLERREQEECLATWWHQATPGTTYWRCLVPARHLPGQTLPLGFDDLQERDGVPYMPRQRGGTAVWQFLGDMNRSKLAFAMRELHGTRLLIEVDDNYLRPAPYAFGRKHTYWSKTIAESGLPGRTGYSNEAHRLLVPNADGVIAATDYLADRYSDFNDNVHVCPNSIDPDDWQYDRSVRDVESDFRVVYYGSPSHTVDAPLVTRALKWASRQPGVTVFTVGFHNPSWSFEHKVVPWNSDLVEARKTLFHFDVGIAPLKRNDWANGKSDVKALEYAMAGVCPLVSDAPPYSPWRDVCDGQFVVSDDGWEDAIRWAVQNRDSVAFWANQARNYVVDRRTIQSTIHLWREAVAG